MLPRTAPVVALVGSIAGCGRTGVLTDGSEMMRICAGDWPYAARVVTYEPDHSGAPYPESDLYDDPQEALGQPDAEPAPGKGAVALGQGGLLELAFEGCQLAPSGDALPDLRVYEAGPFHERASLSLHLVASVGLVWGERLGADDDGWVDVGPITGPATDVDVDLHLPALDPDEVRFDAVRLLDDLTEGGWGGEAPGADIDAVELLEFDAP